MYPFPAMPAPVLRDDQRYAANFGPLPSDTLAIVVRSIAHGDRPSLLNLAQVNKSAYLQTRWRRELLGLLAEGGGEGGLARIQDERRFQHVLCLLGAPHPTVPGDAMRALLAHWMDRLFPRRHAMCQPDSPLPMARQLLQALCQLPMPVGGELLWRLLSAQDATAWMHGEDKRALLRLMEKAADVLPEEQRDGYALACRVAGWRHESRKTGRRAHDSDSDSASEDSASEDDSAAAKGEQRLFAASLKAACDRCLLDPGAWPLPALALMLDVIASHMHRLPPRQRDEQASGILKATAAWPALHRSRVLASLVDTAGRSGIGQDVADAIVSRMPELEGMLDELPSLDDDDRLILLKALMRLIRDARHLCEHCGDEAAATAAMDGIASRIGMRTIEHMLALPNIEDRYFEMRDTLEQALQLLYGWNGVAQQWQEGFEAICAANRRVHGVSYGPAPLVLGQILFKRDSLLQYDAWHGPGFAWLKADGKATCTEQEARTWRLFKSVVENHIDGLPGHACGWNENNALRNAEALLIEPHIMTDAAWVEMMRLTLIQIRVLGAGCRIVHQVLRHAGAVPQDLRAKLLVQIAWLINGWEPAYQSGVVDILLSMVGDLDERRKADLLPGLAALYLQACPGNSDAQLWLPAIMRLCDGLPQPLKARALETLLDDGLMAQADPGACAALLSELQRQIATLPAQPQACLLLSLSLCMGLLGERMLPDVMAQLDSLDLSPSESKAWRLLYRAACLHACNRKPGQALLPEMGHELGPLPDAWRQATQAMLKGINALPRYPARETGVADKGKGCVIA